MRGRATAASGARAVPPSGQPGPFVAPATGQGSTTTAIPVDGTAPGRVFDGVGAISGGGGNSRFLIDYPAAQRAAILDYLFKPGYGASLQVLKVEIGGDANSTDGSEASIEHSQGVVNCNAGYEWWLMEQAKARNPNIKLYALAWAAPGWTGSFWSQATIGYIVQWLTCARQHGLTIDYLGGQPERGPVREDVDGEPPVGARPGRFLGHADRDVRRRRYSGQLAGRHRRGRRSGVQRRDGASSASTTCAVIRRTATSV